jgi:hypothetical protein
VTATKTETLKTDVTRSTDEKSEREPPRSAAIVIVIQFAAICMIIILPEESTTETSFCPVFSAICRFFPLRVPASTDFR